jgi:hypothetical protein
MASSKSERRARLILYDTLAMPKRQVNLIADLLDEGMLTHSGVGGEILLFQQDGRALGSSMTGGDGRAVKPLVARATGETTLSVRLLSPGRVTASEATARLYVWNSGRPVVLICFSALIRPSPGLFPLPSLTDADSALADPEKEAVAMLSRIARRLGFIYLSGADRWELSVVRQWAEHHGLPLGPIFLRHAGGQALANQLDQWKRDGWKIKAGLAATPEEAKVLVTRNVQAIVPPFAVSRGKWPEKAIKSKDWQDVEKRLAG